MFKKKSQQVLPVWNSWGEGPLCPVHIYSQCLSHCFSSIRSDLHSDWGNSCTSVDLPKQTKGFRVLPKDTWMCHFTKPEVKPLTSQLGGLHEPGADSFHPRGVSWKGWRFLNSTRFFVGRSQVTGFTKLHWIFPRRQQWHFYLMTNLFKEPLKKNLVKPVPKTWAYFHFWSLQLPRFF